MTTSKKSYLKKFTIGTLFARLKKRSISLCYYLAALKRAQYFVHNFRTALIVDSYLNLGRLLGQQHRVDAGKNTALRDGHVLEDLAQFLIVEDGQLEVARVDNLLVVPGSVAGELHDLGSQVLQDSSHVDCGTLPSAGGVVSLLELLQYPCNRKHNTSLSRGTRPFLQSSRLPGCLQNSLELDSTLLQIGGGIRHLFVNSQKQQ
jgi:hypothetical protein